VIQFSIAELAELAEAENIFICFYLGSSLMHNLCNY